MKIISELAEILSFEDVPISISKSLPLIRISDRVELIEILRIILHDILIVIDTSRDKIISEFIFFLRSLSVDKDPFYESVSDSSRIT